MSQDKVIVVNCTLCGTGNVSKWKQSTKKLVSSLCSGAEYWKVEGIQLLGNTWRYRDTIHVIQEIG